jgi:CelD/BcsL family acetyltransferase involved in cellulose biosynthesis
MSVPVTWRTELIHTRETFFALRPDYCALLQRSSANNIFTTWEWISTWMNVYGANATPFVVIVRDEADRLVAAAPFKIASRRIFGLTYRQLGFIGTGESVSPEFLDIVVNAGDEQRVVPLLGEAIVKYANRWDKMLLTDVLGDSTCAGQLVLWLHERGHQTIMQPDRVCPFMRLPSTWEACEAGFGRSFKRHLRRDRRRLLSELGGQFEVIGGPEEAEVGQAMDDLASLHMNRMESTHRGGNFVQPDYRAFHQAIARQFARQGWLFVAFLRLNGKRIAARYGYVYGGTYYAYQSGFDTAYSYYSPSKVLLSCVVMHFIENRVQEFNFLRGAQRHKYEWTACERRTTRLLVWNRTSRGLVLMLLDKLVAAVRTLKRRFQQKSSLLETASRLRHGDILTPIQ